MNDFTEKFIEQNNRWGKLSIADVYDKLDKLTAVAEAASGLIEEIAASGTHTRWKRTANAIHELNARLEQRGPS